MNLPLTPRSLASATLWTVKWLSTWLRRRDWDNQAVMDALANRVHVQGAGVVIVSKPADKAADAWKTRNVVSIDGGPRRELLFGSTFHPLDPGDHVLSFGQRGPFGLGTRAEVSINVRADRHVTVFYRPGMWPRGEVTAEVQA